MKNFTRLKANRYSRLTVIAFVTVLVFTMTAATCGGKNKVEAQESGDNGGGGRTAAFFKVFESGTYHMKAKMVTGGVEVLTEIYARGDRMAATSTTQGITSRMVLRDNKTYMIVDATRMIMVMPLMSATEAGGVETNQMRFSSSGTARFDGRNLPYDEYTNPERVRVQYFVDGNRLAGIRTISRDGTVDLIITEFNQNVPNNVFNIPGGYHMMEMP